MTMDKTYNREIAAAIDSFLTEDDWKYYFDEARGVFRFSTGIEGRMKKVDCIVRVESHYYMVRANYPLGVDMKDAEQVSRMCEFMARANDGLIRGCMTMDFDDGELSWKYTQECGDMVPDSECVKHSVVVPGLMASRYAPGVLEMIFGSATPEEAVEKCEKKSRSQRDALLAELTERVQSMTEEVADSDDSAPSGIDAILAALDAKIQALSAEAADEEAEDDDAEQ